MARSTKLRSGLPHRSFTKTLFCSVVLISALVAPAQATPTITLASGVVNPPSNVQSTGLASPQTAIADTAAVVSAADASTLLQATLNAQGFTVANHWSLVTNVVPLAETATFNVTAYNLFLHPAGTAFGETMDFTLSPNPAAPTAPPGSTVTNHWLQYINTNQKVNGYGFAITGQPGFWQMDNGQISGGAAAGAETGGPYYDSNSHASFSVPPTFHDAPQFYAGPGTYLHFVAFPAWDIFTPAAGSTPATESINIGSHGISWGFRVIPEPSTILLVALGLGGIAYRRRRRAETWQ